ncbi:MAG: hypothetical protein ACQERN_11710 [Thermodesulfobacteriota bacterium]
MENTKQKLLDQLIDINAQIDELEASIPPHSVQPGLIARLDELEAERDRLLTEMERQDNANHTSRGE